MAKAKKQNNRKTNVKKQTNKKLNTKKQNQSQIIEGNEIKNLIKKVLIVCAVLLVFYIITILVNREDNSYIEDTTPTIQYSKILVGQILNRNENEYYVLVEKENDQYLELYNYYLTNNEDIKYYTVDLSDVFNGNNIGEETVVNGDVSEFKFSNTTLIKVKNGKVSEVYKERDSIVSYLENLK